MNILSILKNKALLIFFLLASSIVYSTDLPIGKGLTPAEELAKYKELYPEEVAIYLNKSEKVEIKVVGDSLAISVYHTEEILHLKESSNYLSKDKIYSSHFSKVSDISAKTLIPGKKKYQEVEVTEFKETNSTESFVFYDDSKFIEFVFPSVQVGAKTILTYKETLTDPHFLGSHFFQSFIPIENTSFTVLADKTVKMNFKQFNTEGYDLKYDVSEVESGVTKHEFNLQKADKLEYESDAPKINYFAPHLNSMIASYEKSDGTVVSILSGPDDLVKWYKTFIDGKNDTSSPELKAIVEDITNDSMTELEKVKAIYYWVQNNIKYIAFEDGMRGFIPHGGGYVCEKRYGDCKDMSSIIVNMLGVAGIEANFTWIGSRDLPYRYEELPSPSSDNHMIATYKSGDDYYFLDATSSYTPFGLPTSMIQGKDALISTKDGYEIVPAPIINKEDNLMKDVYSYELTEKGIKGTGKVTLSGYPKVFNTHRMVKADQKSTDNYINRLLSRGSNKFFVDDYNIANLEDFDQPITVDYQFRVEDCYNKVGDDIYININLDKAYSGAYIEDRELPKENDYKYINESLSSFQIPEGYKVKFLPDNSTFGNELFGYNIEYSIEGDQINLNRSFYLDYLIMNPEDFPKWNEAIKKFTEANRQVVILTKS